VVAIFLRDPHIRSVTNVFICNLSIADLLVTIFVEPLTLLQNIFVGWHWGATTCWCVPYLQGISVCASSLSLLVIAFDRYLAVCFPMKRLIRRGLAKKIIAVIWLISAALFIPWACFYRLTEGPDGGFYCREFWPSVTADRAFFLGVVTLLVYTAPLLFMAYCYCSIIFRIWMRVRKGQPPSMVDNPKTTQGHTMNPVDNPTEAPSYREHDTNSETCCYTENQRTETASHLAAGNLLKMKEKSKNVRLQSVGGLNRVKTMKIIKMLAIVVINFCICWLPLFAIFNIIKFSPAYSAASYSSNSTSLDPEKDLIIPPNVIRYVVPFAQLLGSANSCVNPWIYCFYSKCYRHGFKRVFLCKSMKRSSIQRPHVRNQISRPSVVVLASRFMALVKPPSNKISDFNYLGFHSV
uniref:G_PROTEIN_RECEP_F1_2 domain-containing protein n=1 Tax=Mesocestoides corti TaxID=53468 RepID=A0A5K3F8X3_MESCO